MGDAFISTLEYYRKRGMLVHLDISESKIAKTTTQTVGFVVCEECKVTYDRHPYIDNILNHNYRPYIHLLCDGTTVRF